MESQFKGMKEALLQKDKEYTSQSITVKAQTEKISHQNAECLQLKNCNTALTERLNALNAAEKDLEICKQRMLKQDHEHKMIECDRMMMDEQTRKQTFLLEA